MTRQMVPDRTDLLRQMHISRAFEEMAERSYAIGKVHGTMHLAMGMKASAVGSIADLNLRIAELLGKTSG